MPLCPDPYIIATFLRRVVGSWSSDGSAADFVVEISAIETGHGRVQRSFHAADGWEVNAAHWAAEQNRTGANIYWVPQPKSADAQHRAASDADIVSLVSSFIDQDGEDAIDWEELPIAPTIVVETGTVPHVRRHPYYLLSAPVQDQDQWRHVQKAMVEVPRHISRWDPNTLLVWCHGEIRDEFDQLVVLHGRSYWLARHSGS
jgi:hypothetical protein